MNNWEEMVPHRCTAWYGWAVNVQCLMTFQNTELAHMILILNHDSKRKKNLSDFERFIVGDDSYTHAFVQYVRKNRRAISPQVSENVNAGSDKTASARTDDDRETYYSWDAAYKHHKSRQWCKNHPHSCKKVMWSDESLLTVWSSVCVVLPRRTVRASMFNPYSEGV